MLQLADIQAHVNRNAVLRTAQSDGTIRLVYRQPAVSADRLTVTWRLSVLLLDASLADIIEAALVRQGFTVQKQGETLQATREVLLTAQQRQDLAQQEQQAEARAKEAQQQEQQQATAATIAELQDQLDALRNELELLQLIKPKGRPGPQGKPGEPGPPGRDGRDLLATSARLSDLQDVADQEPEQGQVLTWDQALGQWEPKAPRAGVASIGGGGAGGMAGLTVGTFGPDGFDVGTEVNTIRFDAGSGFTVVEGPDGATEARVSLNSTFKTWHVAGQADLVAQGEDEITIEAGSGITLSTTPTGTKTLRIDSNATALTYWQETAGGHLQPLADDLRDLGQPGHSIRSIYLGGRRLEVNAEGLLIWDGQVVALANDDYSPVADGGAVTETGTPDPVDFIPMVPGLEADGGSLS